MIEYVRALWSCEGIFLAFLFLGSLKTQRRMLRRGAIALMMVIGGWCIAMWVYAAIQTVVWGLQHPAAPLQDLAHQAGDKLRELMGSQPDVSAPPSNPWMGHLPLYQLLVVNSVILALLRTVLEIGWEFWLRWPGLRDFWWIPAKRSQSRTTSPP